MTSSFNVSPKRTPATTAPPTSTTTPARLTSAVSRLRSSSMKKPPEPLRRAVADSLSSASSSTVSSLSPHHHATTTSSVHASEAFRTLRDYLATTSTTDLAYFVILEHTLAERDRSPAVVARCVSLLKRYLLRYKPSEETLLQIDKFCVHLIAECDVSLSRKLLPWSVSLNQQSSAVKTPSNSATPLPVSSFASAALVKSLNYVRSLVAQHIPRHSFQPAAFAGSPASSRQFLPSLSSVLSRSFNSQLIPTNNGEPPTGKDVTLSVPSLRKTESFDGSVDKDYISSDVFNWRWATDQQSTGTSAHGDHSLNGQRLGRPSLLEVGASSLLMADMDAKKGQPWKHFGTADMPYLNQLLQPTSMSSGSSGASARHHLRIITASKRTKSGSEQMWEDCSVSTFRPRARPLFQYRHYSEQQPLKLNPSEVGVVIAAVCSETPLPNTNMMTISTGMNNHRTKPSIDVAVSVLIKLVIDMYVLDSESASPLTLSMLEDMVLSPIVSSRTRAFDLVLNLAVHAHLLEPVVADDVSTIEEDYPEESSSDSEAQLATQRKRTQSFKIGDCSAINKFESWILNIFYEILVLLVQIEEKEESVWASALSCLLYFVCDRGRIRKSRLKGLDIRVMKALIENSRFSSWAEAVHSKLLSMLATMFYEFPDESGTTTANTPKFLAGQVELIGGIEFIFLEYALAKTREEMRNLYSLLFDYVLHHINLANISTGVPEHPIGEIQPLASLLCLANAPEAFHISIKLGVERIGEILGISVSTALSKYSNSEQLNILLQKITAKFDLIISSFTHLEKEFSAMRQLTISCKLLRNIEDGAIGRNVGGKAKLSWATLHSLLHSDRAACRRNGYIWLGDLLISEISEEKGRDVVSSISSLQKEIAKAGLKDASAHPDIPLSIWLMCGLLKSKNNIIRAGFLFVLEVLLMRCKFLLDEGEINNPGSNASNTGNIGDHSLGKANSVIDIMSKCLSLVTQINETDHFNILKMCDIIFSQLCLKVPPASVDTSGDGGQSSRGSRSIDINNTGFGECLPLQENIQRKGLEHVDNFYSSLICETSSMAAFLLQGRAVVPIQLVARVPAVLFYWPLIQLAGAATDNIALGVSVGSKGRGNLPGATSDIRAGLLLLLIAKCTADPTAFEEVDGEDFFRQLLDDTDSRVAYYSSAFLLKRMMTADFDNYQRMLQKLVFRAQQSNNEKLLENPYLQMRGILQLSSDLGSGL